MLLTTDGYKFSMAQAGFPLREETFYFSFRKGGWQYIPFDLEERVRSMLDLRITGGDAKQGTPEQYLEREGYGLTAGMKEALKGEVKIKAAPADTWVYEREPILTVTGPSFLVSWLEPQLLQLFFPIQFATQVMRAETPGYRAHEHILENMFAATCRQQAELMQEVLEALPVKTGKYADQIVVEDREYVLSVETQIKKLTEIVDPSRIFEVGMRAASCMEQHKRVQMVMGIMGVKLPTSNVENAYYFQAKPVGTMGHEHVQRWGNDLDAFRAMRDMRGGAPSYLLDTFDTIRSGIPTAIKVMQEREHACSVRYDSGDKFGQYIYAHGEFKRHGLNPTHILEDGLGLEDTRKFEQLREFTGLPPEKQLYGYGGFLVSRHWKNPLTRDRVAAVYKLSETSGEPRMKFGNEAGLGKISVPGKPVAWRRLRGAGPLSMIGQEGEEVAENYIALNGNRPAVGILKNCNVRCQGEQPYLLSPQTEKLVESIKK